MGEECTDLIVGDFIEVVDSSSINAYPNGGIKDGYYYEVTGEEIAITENGNFDVRPYAIANVDVAPVLLWTNASPTSSFAAQKTTRLLALLMFPLVKHDTLAYRVQVRL